MITTSGSLILGKYLINQAPSYASHIAVGCGAEPRTYVSFTISSKARVGSTVTIVTSSAHDLRVGDSVRISGCGAAFDGVQTVTTVASNSLSFTYTSSFTFPQISAVTPSTPSSGYALYTTASAHGLMPGDLLTITGISPSGYNQSGVAVYQTPSSTTFSMVEVTTGTATTSATTIEVVTTPIAGATVTLEYSSKKTLDYEMFRVPIISRSFINEDGVNKVVFTGELPTNDRYDITEVGIYSSGTNPVATTSDSRQLVLFSENLENWEYHSTTVSSITQPLTTTGATMYSIGAVNGSGSPTGIIDVDNMSPSTVKSFFASASDVIFDYVEVGSGDANNRVQTKERPRFYNSFLAVRGNTSTVGMNWSITNVVASGGVITFTTSTAHRLTTGDLVRTSGINPSQYNLTNVKVLSATPGGTTFTVSRPETGSYVSGGTVTVVQSGEHIHKTNTRVNLSSNSSDDQLKLAFSLLRKTPQSNNGMVAQTDPDNIYVTVEFGTDETESEYSEFARMEIALSATDINNAKDSLYFVATKKLSELITTSSFNWASVRIMRIYVSVVEAGVPSGNYYIALDGLRFENITAIDLNPLYGLTAYGTMSNLHDGVSPSAIFGKPVTKKQNTSNLIEFKFAVGVQ